MFKRKTQEEEEEEEEEEEANFKNFTSESDADVSKSFWCPSVTHLSMALVPSAYTAGDCSSDAVPVL